MGARRPTRGQPSSSIPIRAALAALSLAASLLTGCDVAERPRAAQIEESATDVYSWPERDLDIAVLEIEDRGEIRVALYAELAPKNVASFVSLSESGYYEGITFHRVIRDFMIQAGDPLTRDDDPKNDGRGELGYSIDDEFSDAPFLRGVVGVANEGRPDTGGGEFFIMHKDQRGLDGQYTVLGRVVSGMPVVDDIALTQTDVGARWGPVNRPLEDIVIERIRIERAGARPEGSGGAAVSKISNSGVIADVRR